MSSSVISPRSALLIGINTIIGAGVFVNIAPLVKLAGPLSFLGYWAAFLILLPSMLSLGRFAKLEPRVGGIYFYPKKYLSPFLGFMSGWNYFVAKSATVALLVHAFITFFYGQGLLPTAISPFVYDIALVFLLATMNALGVSVGGRIQLLFTALKLTPFFAIIFLGLPKVIGAHVAVPLPWNINYGMLIPIALFAFSGYEGICAIGDKIENPGKNAERIIVGTGALVLFLYTILQGVCGILGALIAEKNISFLGLVTNLITQQNFATAIVYCGFMAILSAIFSNIANNSWNAYALAADGFLPGKKYLTHINKHQVPLGTMALKIALIIFFLMLSQEQVILQNMSVACVTIAYILNLVAALRARLNFGVQQIHPLISFIGILSCGYIIIICATNLQRFGVSLPFAGIILSGFAVAFFKHKNPASLT